MSELVRVLKSIINQFQLAASVVKQYGHKYVSRMYNTWLRDYTST